MFSTVGDSGRRLRHAKRYMAVPSPLPAVDWWRVSLDEAQMVECPTAKVSVLDIFVCMSLCQALYGCAGPSSCCRMLVCVLMKQR